MLEPTVKGVNAAIAQAVSVHAARRDYIHQLTDEMIALRAAERETARIESEQGEA